MRKLALLALLILACTLPSCLTQEDDSDGRTAPCHVVTREGVTEHLDAYASRCC